MASGNIEIRINREDAQFFADLIKEAIRAENGGREGCMSPAQFAAQMKNCTYEHQDVGHIDMDELMCDLLESLGYGEGVEIFKNFPKFYS